jgi:[pyruvate, water dikinase]-phosphate phosphotransferase / [pyruvate, water dikinase] kinase
MNEMHSSGNKQTGRPNTEASIYIVSGGAGASGEHLVRTVLAQFGRADAPISILARVRTEEKVKEAVDRAAQSAGIIVHTMVDAELRQKLKEYAGQAEILAIDLIGPLLTHLQSLLQRAPAGEPGLYRQLNREYFERIEALEFTMRHDDGRRPEDLPKAQIVLVGVSRVGKTPLSIYLSLVGWKVANVPLVRQVDPPPELFQVDQRRIVGLTITPRQLGVYRRWRQHELGIPDGDYVDHAKISEELRNAQRFFYQNNYPVVDVTNKPIETIAEEVIGLVV